YRTEAGGEMTAALTDRGEQESTQFVGQLHQFRFRQGAQIGGRDDEIEKRVRRVVSHLCCSLKPGTALRRALDYTGSLPCTCKLEATPSRQVGTIREVRRNMAITR